MLMRRSQGSSTPSDVSLEQMNASNPLQVPAAALLVLVLVPGALQLPAAALPVPQWEALQVPAAASLVPPQCFPGLDRALEASRSP